MSWAEHHTRSELAASEADTLLRAGKTAEALVAYEKAAQSESEALQSVDPTKQRTLGITAVSAVALFSKARNYEAAERLAHRWLGSETLPTFAVDQLRTLLQTVWTTDAAHRAGVRFAPGDVLVAVRGGRVVYGGAPLDLIARKVEEVQALFYRTAEMLLGLPLRQRGGPPASVQDIFRPWLFQVPAGSYQFAVRIQEPDQTDLFPNARPQVDQVTHKFLDIVRSSAQDSEVDLAAVVPDKGYRGAFLKLTRNLAPTGKAFEHLEIRDAAEPLSRPIYLGLGTRGDINAAIRRERPPVAPSSDTSVPQVRGVLRAVHLDLDWLEVSLEGAPDQHVKIYDAGEVLDDVIGPMVNRRVIVTATKKGGRLSYQDIEADEQ